MICSEQKGQKPWPWANLFFFPCCVACRILVPPPGIKPVSPTVEVQSLSQWTAREVQANILGGVSSLPPLSLPRGVSYLFCTHENSFFLVICQWCICTFTRQLIYVYVSLPQLDIKLMCKGSVYLSFLIPEKINHVRKVFVIPKMS